MVQEVGCLTLDLVLGLDLRVVSTHWALYWAGSLLKKRKKEVREGGKEGGKREREKGRKE